jgi:hypothetical protein
MRIDNAPVPELTRLVQTRGALADVARVLNASYAHRVMPPVVAGIVAQVLAELADTEAQMKQQHMPILFKRMSADDVAADAAR